MQAGDLLRLGFEYGTTNNNGNVLNQTIARPSFSVTQTYTYDAYNRIQKVEEGANNRDFQYKEPGNMYVPSSQGTGWAPGSFTPASPSWFDEKNRLVNPLLGIQYDTAGNLTAIGGFTFAYDAENRLVSSTLNSVRTEYAYDGEGRRVKKGSVMMVYDAFGRLAAEYGATADPVGTEYLTADHLGSTRLVTSAAGAERRCLDYLPFGEQMTQGMGTRGACYAIATEPRVKFTGKERDSETGLDFFEARHLSSTQGRFTSTDPLISGPHKLNDPQNWNLYGYARNNPLRFTDPSGEIIEEDIDDEYRKRYERWKKDYLSTVAGRRQWERYANDPNLTLTIRFDKAKSQGAEAGNYQWNSAGELTAATITLGPKLDSGYPSSVSYPITSSLQGANVSGTVLAVTKLAHEFGHVNRTGQENAAFYQLQNQLIPQYNALFFASGRDPYHPGLKALEQQMGGTPIDISIRREHWAEANTVPYLRDRFPGKSMPNQIKQAIANYQKTYPGRVP